MQSSDVEQRQVDEESCECAMARTLAPEEIHVGDYVTQLYVTYDLPSYLWTCTDPSLKPNELVRLQMIPAEGGAPLKVKSVCLPFVEVEAATSERTILDIRKTTLARLSHAFAKSHWKALKKAAAKASQIR